MSNVIIKQMTGHSGCKVFLCEENNQKYVRKISSSVDYNDRLQKQMKKQLLFRDSVLKVPKIYATGFEEGKLYFDMEFIKGVTFSNFISTNSPNNALPIFEKIIAYLGRQGHHETNVTSNIEKKIESLTRSLESDYSKYFNYCLAFDWRKISTSMCHGDLTFENIIVYKSDIYLIDFLDSFIESKYVDYSKLLQDIILAWSWRNNVSPPIIKCMFLYSNLCKNLSGVEIEMTKRLLILNILRIIPYADENRLEYLKDRLLYLEDKFKI
jgi:tRNA A-37 threonylcarbamoyl transferase component Bud32